MKCKTGLLMSLFLTAALAVLGPSNARGDTVTFDDILSVGNPIRTTPVASGSYTFGSAHYHIIDSPGICSFGGCVSNGTQYLGLDGPTLGFPVTMTHSGGSSFALLSLDAAKVWLDVGGGAGFPNALTLDVLGNLTGGGTVSTSFVLPAEGAFGAFLFPATFTGLSSAVFSGTGGGSNNASWAVDNIGVRAVPEPASSLLLGLGLGFLALRRRK